MSTTPVLVFGPTGNVGAITAITARSKNVSVVLAMRDPSKAIPGISINDGNYTRVQADLSDPVSITNAVSSCKAKRAFIYCHLQSTDGMASALHAMRASGIEEVIFLSSNSIREDPASYTAGDIIPYIHAKVELNLERIFPDAYVALRPGNFATNLTRYYKNGQVRSVNPDFRDDWISAEDMGAVAGNLLANGFDTGVKAPYLFARDLITMREAWRIIGQVLGKEVTVTRIGRDDALQDLVADGVPKPIAEYLVREHENAPADGRIPRALYDEGVANIERYAGRPGLRFENWVKAHKELFES